MARPLGAKDKKKRKSRGRRILEGSAFLGVGAGVGAALDRDSFKKVPGLDKKEYKKQLKSKYVQERAKLIKDDVSYYKAEIKHRKGKSTKKGYKKQGAHNAKTRKNTIDLLKEIDPQSNIRKDRSRITEMMAQGYREDINPGRSLKDINKYRDNFKRKIRFAGVASSPSDSFRVNQQLQKASEAGRFLPRVERVSNRKRGALIGLGAGAALVLGRYIHNRNKNK